MLNNITWQGYWTTLALLSVGYYLVIYLLFYRKDFQIILPKQKHYQPSNALYSTSSPSQINIQRGDREEFSTPTGGDETAVCACMDELNAYFEESKRRKCVKEEVLYAINRILLKYAFLKESEYKESISNVIVSEAKQHCSIQLSSEEIVQVWLER